VSEGERAPAGNPNAAGCGAGCGRAAGRRCSYRDVSGRRCGHWCEEHSVFSGGRTWCLRHVNSVRWLELRDGSTYEVCIEAPIDDRSPNLVGMLVEDLNRPMTAGLMAIYGRRQGVQIVTDGHVRTAHRENGSNGAGKPGWERGWVVYTDAGDVARVALRAAPAEPPTVDVYANGALVLSRVPDWIANRGRGTDPAVDRAKFRRDILAAVGPALPPDPLPPGPAAELT
jgi:hypothetical protein